MREGRSVNLRTWLLATLAIASLLAVLFGPMILDRFTLNVLTRSMIYAMLAITVDLLWGFTGILTFGQAAFFGVGAYAAAMLLTYAGGAPGMMILALLVAILIPVLLGALVGWLSFGYGATPLYATVISLVLPIVITQLAFSGGHWTGSSSGLVGYPTLPLGLHGYFRLTGACLLATAVLAWILVRSDAGRVLVAVRDNEMRCAYLGLNPERIKIGLTTVLAGVAGLAGYLYANASGVVAPENAGFVFGTELVISTALGGRGTIIGPIFGTIGIDYLSASLSGELPFLWKLIVGLLFVAMIVLLPNGLAELAARFLPERSGADRRSWPAIPISSHGAEDIVAPPASQPLLTISNLSKSYGSLQVLQGIDLEVRPGELVSLVGPNGAGKTTLMRCLANGTEPMSGAVAIAGVDISGMTPNRIVALGVGRKFQVASVFESLSVADCLRMARSARHRPSLLRKSATVELPTAASDILRLTGLELLLNQRTALLSHGQKQALELAMVMTLEPKLILLDEPTAGLTKTERTTIGEILKTLTSQHGVAAILVEHDLDFVRQISSRIVVLHQGKLVLDGSVAQVVSSAVVRDIYSGTAHG